MEDLIRYIALRTGKILDNGDYGFISTKEGFDIWKKGGSIKTIQPTDKQDVREQIVNFLNEKH
jgi:hypothetical protein